MTTYKRHPLDKTRPAPRTPDPAASDRRGAQLAASWARVLASASPPSGRILTPPIQVTRTRYTPPTI